jgi:hypothetical protein
LPTSSLDDLVHPFVYGTTSMPDFADLKKNVASAEGEFNAQKQQMQDEAEMGETAAAVAAKLPISPETAIEGFMLWRQLS